LFVPFRLANPTNFTKMGLWTLGGGVQALSTSSSNSGNVSSNTSTGGSPNSGSNRGSNGGKNPIAGMLQRELGISAQQGRKILEQRQKIQKVCSNLKEVSLSLIVTSIRTGPMYTNNYFLCFLKVS
jgi:hypothetical protein